MTPVFIAGMRGSGKTTAAKKLGEVGEVIDGEYLQYTSASAIEPESSNEEWSAWKFWTGERLKQLPRAMNDVFVARYGGQAPQASVLVVSAGILVKDWFFAPLATVLAVQRPHLDWSAARFLVLDLSPEEILTRIRSRDRPFERQFTLDYVAETARSYREHHAQQSMVPWQLIKEPAHMEEILFGLHRGQAPAKVIAR